MDPASMPGRAAWHRWIAPPDSWPEQSLGCLRTGALACPVMLCLARYDQLMPDFELDRLSATPLWEQLYSQLREAIVSGAIPPDRKLPTEQALSKDHGTSRGTVARAYELLRSENLIVWQPGKGLYTAPAADIKRARRTRR